MVAGLSGCLGNGDGGNGNGGAQTGTVDGDPELADELRVSTYGGAMGNAITSTVLDGFEEEYGVEIVSGDFPSNWGLISQLQAGEVDVDVLILDNTAVPTAYEADLMLELRPENIPNLERYQDRFDPRNARWDPTENGASYAPFQYFADGMTYNTEQLETPTEWDDMLTEEAQGHAINASWIDRVLGVAGVDIGVNVSDLGTDTESKLNQIWERVEEQNEYIFEWADTGGTIQDAFANGTAYIGMMWYGRATTLHNEDDVPIEYIIPEEGTTMATSGWSVSETTDRRYTAEKFIDYSLSEQAQYDYGEAIGYVPTTEMDELPQIVRDNPDYQQQDRLEFFDGHALMDNQSDWAREFQQRIRQ
ncbi:ABC transporter substrate-binding protein [Halopenitus persicus]|uniref:Spermidine/putrescine-binding protein n=1 Tax=Halopenitus persicus TaxID=1048396 RepID=A0A1H3E925_9EURY|nr:PotD/PotF family extracellular solute-binding protein [Halopenitus persicus]SDX74424.1 Spermidine/putrescine-binding protein [Halopenitus persicus]